MFSKAAEQKERCITIATSTIPAQYILPDILVKFRERFPEEQFRIVESDSSTVIEQVASHLVDIGFSGTVIEKANCKYIPFYQDDLVVIMPNTKEYQKIVKEQKDLKWLEGEPLIMREEGSGTRKEAEKQLKKMGISLDDLNIVATIENPEAVKRSVKSGLGITIISRLATADEIQSGEVLEFPFSQAGSGRNLNLAAGHEITYRQYDENGIYLAPSRIAEYKGGSDAFRQYCNDNVKYPADAPALEKPARVIVQFTIGTKGEVSDTKIMRSCGEPFDSEAIRVVQGTSGQWIPAENDGKPVPSRFTIPITFSNK